MNECLFFLHGKMSLLSFFQNLYVKYLWFSIEMLDATICVFRWDLLSRVPTQNPLGCHQLVCMEWLLTWFWPCLHQFYTDVIPLPSVELLLIYIHVREIRIKLSIWRLKRTGLAKLGGERGGNISIVFSVFAENEPDQIHPRLSDECASSGIISQPTCFDHI